MPEDTVFEMEQFVSTKSIQAYTQAIVQYCKFRYYCLRLLLRYCHIGLSKI